jgi:hypothetical protein
LAWISLVADFFLVRLPILWTVEAEAFTHDFASAGQHQHIERLPGVRGSWRSDSCGPRLFERLLPHLAWPALLRFPHLDAERILCGWLRGRRWLRLFSLQRLWSRRVLVCRLCQFATRCPASALGARPRAFFAGPGNRSCWRALLLRFSDA